MTLKVRMTGIVALVVAVGASAAATTGTQLLITPGITVSNRLTPAKDARVLVFTMTPKTSWMGPYTWRTTLNGADTVVTEETPQYALGYLVRGLPHSDSMKVIRLTAAQIDELFYRRRTMTDTVFQAFPLCAIYRATVFPATVNGVAKRDSLTKRVFVCRVATPREVAETDSFPSQSFKILVCGRYQYLPLDSTNSGPPWRDSLPIGARSDTIVMTVGHMIHLGATLTNRYTGRVELVSGDPMRCEAARASRESERSL